MPEGHTIHRLAKDLASDLVGHQLEASSPQGRFEESAAELDGRALTATEAYGKHLFLWWGHEVVHVHLGLFGKFRKRGSPPPEPVGAVRLRLVSEERTWDLSGPTICALGPPDLRDEVVARLGPDPLRKETTLDEFATSLSKRRKAIGSVLLDQKAVSGVGNVYRAEILFICGIHPDRPANELNKTEVEGLWTEIRAQLRAGVKRNRIVTTDPKEIGVTVSKMRKDDRLYVYKRDTCRRCATEITRTEQANRNLFYCPTCQNERNSDGEL